MKTNVLAFLVMTSLLSAGPQTSAGSIEGTVVRLGTTDPIAGVNIEMRRVEGTAASPCFRPYSPAGISVRARSYSRTRQILRMLFTLPRAATARSDSPT